MKTVKMLPYCWKTVGRALLVLCVLLFVVCFHSVANELFWAPYKADAFGADWASTVIALLFCIAPILIAFSFFLEEDERISLFRQQALVRTVILYIIVVVISVLGNVVLSYLFRDQQKDTLVHIMVIKKYFTSLPAFILYYLLIFRVSLWSENKKLLRDEE